MIILTYWYDPINKTDTEDFESITWVNLKSVKQIPELVANRPKNCTMISTERSAERLLKTGRRTNYFKQIWRTGDGPIRAISSKCPLCGSCQS